MPYFHPSLVSSKLVETVNFYEDFFGFVPLIEKDGYVLLEKVGRPDMRIAVYDVNHKCVATRVSPSQGLILNLPVVDAESTYDELYMEGLDIYKEIGDDIHGQKHFVVYDPNGVLINVVEPEGEETSLAA